MRFPPSLYQVDHLIAHHFPLLRPAHQRGVALWVVGTILAQRACQNAVITALLLCGNWHAVRQHLREGFYDGADKAAPWHTHVDVACCFAPLVRWVLHWWHSAALAVAGEAPAHGDQSVALVGSVVYRGGAIPVAWHSLPATSGGCLDVADLARAAPAACSGCCGHHRSGAGGSWAGESPRVEAHVRSRLASGGARPAAKYLAARWSVAPAGAPVHAWVGHGMAFQH